MINFGDMEWEVGLIQEHFNEDDAQAIFAIPLSDRLPNDSISWDFTKKGEYSVKTAYMDSKGGSLDLFHKVSVKIWSLHVAPKVHHFLWRLCSNSLPLRAFSNSGTLWMMTAALCVVQPRNLHSMLSSSFLVVEEVWGLAGISSIVP